MSALNAERNHLDPIRTQVADIEIRWALLPTDPLMRCDDDWQYDARLYREWFLLAVDRIAALTHQLDAARNTIRELRRQERAR